MKNHFLISESEKNRIRNLHKAYLHSYGTGQLIKEVYKSIVKLLGRESAEALSKKYTDDSLKAFNNLFAKAVGKNIGGEGSAAFIKSASGMEVPVWVFQGIINKKLAGESMEVVMKNINQLPRYLADGTEFRTVFVNNLKSLKPRPVVAGQAAVPKLGRGVGETQAKSYDDILTYMTTHEKGIKELMSSSHGPQKAETLFNQAKSIVQRLKNGGKLGEGNLDGVTINYITSTVGLRNTVDGIIKTGSKVTTRKALGKALGKGEIVKDKYFLTTFNRNQTKVDGVLMECWSNTFCNTTPLLNQLKSKIPTTKFDPTTVKILKSAEFKGTKVGREAALVRLPNGKEIIMYKSSGSNVATTGKKAGEWVAIPGWAQNGWFIKTEASVQLTKGGNKYLTDFAQYLEKNGL